MVDSDYYRNWTPQNPKSGLQPAATLQTVIDNKMMDSAEGKNYGDKENVLIYKLTTRTDATVVILHYIKDGREDINLTQELHRSTFRGVDYPDGSNYKYTENYSPKNLTGYTLITNNNIDKRNPSDDAVYAGYTPDIGAHGDYTGKTGQFIDDEVTTTIEKYEYTRKYPDRHYYTLAGYDRWGRPIYDELRVVIGNSGERYDVGLKYGDTDYVGTVYYRDWGGSYHSMSMDEFKSRDFVENVTYPTVTIESNINVFFYYAKEIYKVNLMELDGTTTKETLNVPYGDLVSDKLVGHDPTQAPAEGKTFVGWSVSPDTYEPFTSFMPARPITLYQIWDDTKVKVTTQGYDLNGDPISEGGEEGVYEAKYNSLFREFGVRDPKIAEPGYAFGGWEKEVEENGETKWKPIKLSERLVDDTLIKPVWIDIHAANVTYVLNGGDGTIEGTTPVDGEAGHYIDSSSYLLGSKAEIKSGAALTKTEGTGADAVNYRFVCWNTKEDGSGEDYYAGDSIALSSHGITLYARYVAKREVTLKYDLNADDDENAKFYDYNATKKKYEETTDTAKEYLLIDSGDSKTAAGKINNLYTAGTEINDAKVANNESLVKFLPVRPGYVFKGWSRKSEGPVDVKDGATIRVNTLENKSTTKTDTLYAIWEKDRLPIEVYTYEDEAIDDAVLKNKDSDGKTLAGYWRTTAMTAALPPDTVESAYHVQVGGDNAYKLDDFAYEKAIVIEKAGDNEAEKEIDKLQYVLKSDGSGYEWQYRLKAGNGSSGDASAFKPVSEEYPVKVYFHKNNTADLTITKTVEGKYANMGQEFTFTIRVEGAQSATYDYHDYTKSSTSGATPSDGTGATPSDGTGTTPSDGTSATTSGTTGTIADGGAFTLGHGGSITIKVPKNKKITITETPLVDGYTPSFTGGQHVTIQKDADDQVENGVVVKVNGQGGTLAVTNTFNDKSVVPSGIEGSNSILIPVFAGLVLALGLVMSISRRRRLGIRK